MQKYSVSEEKLALYIFLFVVGFIICYWYFAFDGFYFFDDTAYSRYAWQVTQGNFTINQNDTFAHRLGVFIPVAAIYSLTGITDYATILWPLLVFLGSSFVLFFCLKKKSVKIALYSVVIASLNFYLVFFSNKLYPDSIVAFFTLAATFVLWGVISKPHTSNVSAFFSVFLFCILLFLAFLTKETVLFYIPFYALIFIGDIKNKRNTKFWIYSLIIGLALLVAYFASYYLCTGDAFYRFKVIQEGHYAFAMSYYDKFFLEIIPRLTYQPLLMFISSEMAIPCILALPLLFSLRKNDFFDLNKFENFWKVLSIVLLVMLWFCSTSIKFYNPLSLQPRMYLLIVAPLSILAAVSLVQATKRIILFYCLAFAFCGFLCYYFHISSYIVYFVLTGYFIIILFFNLAYKIIPLLFILLVHPLYSMLKPTDTDYKNEKEAITKFLMGDQGNNIVLTDEQLLSGYYYYYKFKNNPHYQYLEYKKGIPGNFKGNIFVLLNKKSFTNIGQSLPLFVSQKPSNWAIVFQKGDVILYKLNSREDFKQLK